MTPRQQQLLDYVREYIQRRGVAPTYEQMATAVGLASKAGIRRMLDALVAAGHLERTPNVARGLKLPATPSLANVPTQALQRELQRREAEHG